MTRSAGSGARRSGRVPCAIYTRKSSEEGLQQEFNSLQAQREACEAFINSQRHEGWVCLRTGYDDGGFSGATMGRPALQRLLADIAAGRVIGGKPFSRGALYLILRNRIFRGEIVHKGQSHPGEHTPIIDQPLWDAVQAQREQHH